MGLCRPWMNGAVPSLNTKSMLTLDVGGRRTFVSHGQTTILRDGRQVINILVLLLPQLVTKDTIGLQRRQVHTALSGKTRFEYSIFDRQQVVNHEGLTLTGFILRIICRRELRRVQTDFRISCLAVNLSMEHVECECTWRNESTSRPGICVLPFQARIQPG
jgi:hypothetical protein